MLGLSGAEEISTIKQAILIQYRIATDGQTDKQKDRKTLCRNIHRAHAALTVGELLTSSVSLVN